MARPSAAHLAIGTTAQFGVTLLLAIASFLLQIVNAIAAPISLTSHSSMDITVASIESGGNSYQSLEEVLGTAGQVAVYASSGLAGLVDPSTYTVGSATASSDLTLTINDISVAISDLCHCPYISVPSGAKSSLEIGDHLVSHTSGQITLNGVGDSAASGSAPYFQIFINNPTSEQINAKFSYLLTTDGAILGADPLANVGFVRTAGIGAVQQNHDNYLDPIYTGGVGSSLFGSSLGISSDFSISHSDTLNVRLDAASLNYITFYNTHYASGAIMEPISAVPEPSALLLLGSGLAMLAAWRWKHAA